MQLSDHHISLLSTGQISMSKIIATTGLSRREVFKAIAQGVIDGRLPASFLSYSVVKAYHDRMTSSVQSTPISSPALTAVGYDLDVPEKTPADAWAEGKNAFEQRIRKSRHHKIVREDNLPYVIAHFTDVHLDDDGTPLALLEADIRASHEMGAIMVHGGDALNNWPEGGRLSKKYGDQSCTKEDGLLRLRRYIELLRPTVWVDGNHEEFSSHLTYLIDEMLPDRVIKDYWTCDVTIQSPGGRDLRMAVSHKFQKGSSWFHKLHGHIKEILEGEHRDLLLDGHLHSAGVMEHHQPERGTTTLCVASSGYKVVDSYAARISRGGKSPKMKGRTHWIVVDSMAPVDGSFCTAFTDPAAAKAYQDGLIAARGDRRIAA